jgi:D-amino-acid oxidase
MKEFKRLADEEPESHVMYCNGIQYITDPTAPGLDPYWQRKIYYNVRLYISLQKKKKYSRGYFSSRQFLKINFYLEHLMDTLSKLVSLFFFSHGSKDLKFLELLVTANVPKYLQWLVKTIKQLGGHLERRTFDSINEAIEHYKEADTIINCTGLGSYYLSDVKDHTMYPIRGQTVVVRAPHMKVNNNLLNLGYTTCLTINMIHIDSTLH